MSYDGDNDSDTNVNGKEKKKTRERVRKRSIVQIHDAPQLSDSGFTTDQEQLQQPRQRNTRNPVSMTVKYKHVGTSCDMTVTPINRDTWTSQSDNDFEIIDKKSFSVSQKDKDTDIIGKYMFS